MTREEAICLLKIAKDKFNKTMFDYGRTEEALDMAIEALQADTVSREEYDDVKAYMDKLVDAFIEDGEELADSVKVVRCKDCRHLYNKDFCSFFGSPTDAMDYCSHGEMWTNGEKGEEVNGFKSVGQAWNTSQGRWEK